LENESAFEIFKHLEDSGSLSEHISIPVGIAVSVAGAVEAVAVGVGANAAAATATTAHAAHHGIFNGHPLDVCDATAECHIFALLGNLFVCLFNLLQI
jgi:hypothetical protein